jgi:hypothetical protein
MGTIEGEKSLTVTSDAEHLALLILDISLGNLKLVCELLGASFLCEGLFS